MIKKPQNYLDYILYWTARYLVKIFFVALIFLAGILTPKLGFRAANETVMLILVLLAILFLLRRFYKVVLRRRRGIKFK